MSSVSGSATNLIGMVEYTQPEDERWATNVAGMVEYSALPAMTNMAIMTEYAFPEEMINMTNMAIMVEYGEPEATGIATRKMLLGVGR